MRRASLICVVWCAACSASASEAPASGAELLLVREAKLSQLLPAGSGPLEASGVAVSGGELLVVMDNTAAVAMIKMDLKGGSLTTAGDATSQFEGVAVADDGRMYAIREMISVRDRRGAIAELSSAGAIVEDIPTDVSFPSNQGFEGIAPLRVGETLYLLALCQGRMCDDTTKSDGQGRIHVFTRGQSTWVSQRSLLLPQGLDFKTFSDIALRARGDGTFDVAILSRSSSALWLGQLDPRSWTFGAPGVTYPLPNRYCSAEGVTFLSERTIATVTDEDTQCQATAQSVQVFAIP